MNLARQINEKLDQILDIKSEIERINAEVDDDAVLTNIVTGEKQNKEDATGQHYTLSTLLKPGK